MKMTKDNKRFDKEGFSFWDKTDKIVFVPDHLFQYVEQKYSVK